VELLVENIGTEDIRTGPRLSADHRIVRHSDGQVVQQKVAAQSLDILAGQTKRLPVVISTKDDAGKPLPAGDYVFSLSVVRSKVAYLRSQISKTCPLVFSVAIPNPSITLSLGWLGWMPIEFIC